VKEHLEMICEGCDTRFIHEAPSVSVPEFLHDALDLGWRDIGEQENIDEVIALVCRLWGFSMFALFDALCAECVGRVKAHRKIQALREYQA
jgi:hypothetical protein